MPRNDASRALNLSYWVIAASVLVRRSRVAVTRHVDQADPRVFRIRPVEDEDAADRARRTCRLGLALRCTVRVQHECGTIVRFDVTGRGLERLGRVRAVL